MGETLSAESNGSPPVSEAGTMPFDDGVSEVRASRAAEGGGDAGSRGSVESLIATGDGFG